MFDKNQDVINRILDEKIEHFFPKSGEWAADCFQRSKALSYGNLPCHLDNNTWLSKLFYKEFELDSLAKQISKNGGVSVGLTPEVVERYMDRSARFAELKHDYQLKIVKWQINWIMNGGKNWLLPKNFKNVPLRPDLISRTRIIETTPVADIPVLQPTQDDGLELTVQDFEAVAKVNAPDVDEMVYGGVMKTLLSIDFDLRVILEGLEKFAADWRQKSMLLGYQGVEGVKNVDKNHQALWLADREYGYYQRHQGEVDLFGTPTPAMKMSPAEHEHLVQVLQQRDKAQMAAFVAANKFVQIHQDKVEADIKIIGEQIDQTAVAPTKLSKLNLDTKAADLVQPDKTPDDGRTM